jgi:putative transcriptional regulator
MKIRPYLLRSFAAFLAVLTCTASTPRAEDGPQGMMLVATADLDGTPFQRAVLVAAPLSQGGYVGFIINRPTQVRLGSLLPNQPSSGKVIDPVYVGGPQLKESVFALTRKAPGNHGTVIALSSDLFAVLDGDSVERVIESTPNDARFVLGLIIWGPDQLDEQIRTGVWDVRPADANAVFRRKSAGLWDELQGESVQEDPQAHWI